MKNFEYLEPRSVQEACQLLRQHGEEARIFAGGTSLSIVMKQGFFQPKYLVNIKKIPDLTGIRWDPKRGLTLGALVTHRELETSPLIQETFPILSQIEEDVANIRVRVMGTVGGNLAYAEPLTDLPQILIALEASIRVAGPDGDRTMSLEELFVDYYETSLRPDEILTEVLVPTPPPRTGIEYIRFSSSSVIDKPCLGTAVRFTLEEDLETVRTARVVLGCVAPTPLRARQAEALLEGKRYEVQRVKEAAAFASRECKPVSDLRGSEAYKREMVRVLVTRAAPRAFEKARAFRGQV
ncbi:MAG: xanthine dehydrogenase family protein subunit M [Acidobacteria bacterium]|nr:xanthine dehydrogenase family protein subunit M [Acidobacteriota bacterium]